MRRAGSRNAEQYIARLAVERELLDDLVGEITIGETYFFREPEQLSFIRNEVVPELCERRGRSGKLRVWSAGTSSGEEAYSLAITLHELGVLARAHVVGTDICHSSLARAERGSYGRWSFRGVSNDVINRYFVRNAGTFEVVPDIRSAVDFHYANLADESHRMHQMLEPEMDLILCRNVLIYFDSETVNRVARRLVMSLADGGWLIIGGSDPALTGLEGVDVVITSGGLAYRRASGNPAIADIRPAVQESLGAFPPATSPDSDSSASSARRAMSGGSVVDQIPFSEAAFSTAFPPTQSSSAALLSDARGLYGARQYDRAAEIAGELAGRRPNDIDHWTLLIRALANSGRLAEAGRACALGMEHHPTSAELAYLHAMLLNAGDHHMEAAAAARRALFLDRKLVMSHLVLATALIKAGDRSGARRAFRNAGKLLKNKPACEPIAAADGEVAGSLASMVQSQLLLLER